MTSQHSMTTAVKRACDACHRRKVKCDGINPCRNCSASQLSCTYNAIPQKKGPKGSRAKVISELREKQHQTSLTTKVQNRIAGINSPPPAPSLAPTPGLLTPELMRESVEFFFANMYSTMPILHRQRLEQQALYVDQSVDTYCLLTSLCAFMMLQPGMQIPSMSTDPYSYENMMPGTNIVTATLLLEETLRVRKGYDLLESPSLNTLCTSYFLFAYFYGMELHDKAWFYLREATTIAHMIGMSKEETYMNYDGLEGPRRRRLYWLLFVTERAYALQRQRPLTLQSSINLPTATDDPTDPLAHQLSGFLLLVNLFRPFDDAFVALWNRAMGECSDSYVSNVQKQLQGVLPAYLNSQESQLAELQMNQQWLKNMQWQMSLAGGNAGELYSIDIGRDLLPMVSHFPGSLGLLGLSLIEKMCDLTSGLTEFLAMQPASRNPFSPGPREYLHPLLNVISVLRTGDHRFLPLLLTKLNHILPRLANPMLQNAPENANNACNMDIFDGFGNAGMAQPAMFQTEDYDNKFAIPRIEELSNNSGSPNGTSKNDMNSPFVSSPAMMSPGGDMPHGLPEFNSIPDMVMSPMGGSAGSQHTSGSFNGQPAQQHQQHQHQQHLQHQPQQHQQHQSMSGFQNLNPQLNLHQAQNMSIPSQAMGMGPGMGGNNMMSRQAPQRANSFNMTATPQIRTVGDFQALQRGNSDMNVMSPMGINSMGTEMDFNTLPR
ncbi:hypothetical protein CONLIGDRAFT_327868 [Coniochaeta ligniaria NRRL 30616]|uniref:Zn(2)-C6 fungal-type domain-containing protein n=1 Tax=Coniochaeta ligniaria NRRL 30616 TaxID=1408157 RepID=A0A1J7J835_9PEZI|nr:hypothetical protein CONLIGDRAFT_327868 [Coniochaeta ligniaria NRRL 30616]